MLTVISLMLCFGAGHALFIDGCPLYGCRPSGTFSYYLNAPRSRASVAWTTDFVFDPVPSALGCCANSFNIICQSNGPFQEDAGYIALDTTNGTLNWRDKVLRFPTLPLLDSIGDVTGSDGDRLVHYDVRGKLFPVISLVDTKPIYSIELVGTGFLLIVSGNGGLAVRDTNSVPVGILFLNATIGKTNGTFIPISQPVVNGQRFYVLTEFVPESRDTLQGNVNIQRIYALDVHYRLTDRITVAWFCSFTPTTRRASDTPESHHKCTDQNTPKTQTGRRNRLRQRQESTVSVKQNLLWDGNAQSVYAILPSQGMNRNSNTGTTLCGLKDAGDKAVLTFQYELSVTHMASFESDHCDFAKTIDSSHCTNFQRPIWLMTEDSKVCGAHSNGTIFKTIDLAGILKTTISVTSKMSVMRSNDTDIDIIAVGITVSAATPDFIGVCNSFGITDTNATSFVVGIDTGCVTDEDCILWMVAVPGNMEVIGQIAAVTATSEEKKDQLVMYVENRGESAMIISIH